MQSKIQFFPLAEAPSSSVTRLAIGPGNILIAGYANGYVHLWDSLSGAQLQSTRLHGPIKYLLVRKDKMYAISDLGDYVVWDLTFLSENYCSLLQNVWQEIPFRARGASVILQTVPREHRCWGK